MLHLHLERMELWDGVAINQRGGDAGPTFSQEHWALEQ